MGHFCRTEQLAKDSMEVLRGGGVFPALPDVLIEEYALLTKGVSFECKITNQQVLYKY